MPNFKLCQLPGLIILIIIIASISFAEVIRGFREPRGPLDFIRKQQDKGVTHPFQNQLTENDDIIGAAFSPKPLPIEEITEENQNNTLRITFGDYVTIQQYPHHVGLVAGKYVTCGGTIIGAQWILTAAHCTDSLPANQYAVIAGQTNLFDKTGQHIAIIEKFVHPQWSRNTLMNDITLLKLSTPLAFNSAVKPAQLRGSEYVVSRDSVKMSGWGEMENSQYPTNLRAVEVPIVAPSLCSVWGSVNAQTMICAGGGDGKDACAGDSGGPLGQFVNGQFVVGGIVSWGPSICGRAGNRGVYTKVSSYLPWIKSISGI